MILKMRSNSNSKICGISPWTPCSAMEFISAFKMTQPRCHTGRQTDAVCRRQANTLPDMVAQSPAPARTVAATWCSAARGVPYRKALTAAGSGSEGPGEFQAPRCAAA